MDWPTLIPLGLSSVTLLGSALAYFWNQYAERRQRRWNQFLELTKFIDNKDAPLAGKLAALYLLRQFPEHAKFSIRFCDTVREHVSGEAAAPLQREAEETKKFFAKLLAR
jgi:hypothetical protein